MKIRIRERNCKSDIIYDVQVKRGLRWKTISSQVFLEKAMEDVKALRKMEEFNNPTPPKKTYTFAGWAVRNQYSSGPSNVLTVFGDYPKYNNDNKGTIWWSGRETGSIRVYNLFGKEGIEPQKVKITVEEI